MTCEAPRYLQGVINPLCVASHSLFIREPPLLDNETRLFANPCRSLRGEKGWNIQEIWFTWTLRRCREKQHKYSDVTVTLGVLGAPLSDAFRFLFMKILSN